MNLITISFEVKPSLLQEEQAKLYPITTIKQFKAATLQLDKLKASMHWELHAAYALERKIEEAAVLLERQAVKAQGIYNAHLGATPMELSNLGTAHMEMVTALRSNQMALAKRSNQMALRDRRPQTVHTQRRSTWQGATKQPSHMGINRGICDPAPPRFVIQKFGRREKNCNVEFQECLNKRLGFFASWLT